jgi:hypothetical protein
MTSVRYRVRKDSLSREKLLHVVSNCLVIMSEKTQGKSAPSRTPFENSVLSKSLHAVEEKRIIRPILILAGIFISICFLFAVFYGPACEFIGREVVIQLIKIDPGDMYLDVKPESIRIISIKLLSIEEANKQGLGDLVPGWKSDGDKVWIAQYECLGFYYHPFDEFPKPENRFVPMMVWRVFNSLTFEPMAVRAGPV